jgi:hypothetical protein
MCGRATIAVASTPMLTEPKSCAGAAGSLLLRRGSTVSGRQAFSTTNCVPPVPSWTPSTDFPRSLSQSARLSYPPRVSHSSALILVHSNHAHSADAVPTDARRARQPAKLSEQAASSPVPLPHYPCREPLAFGGVSEPLGDCADIWLRLHARTIDRVELVRPAPHGGQVVQQHEEADS